MNQKERILAQLRKEPTCGTTFYRWMMPRYSARINELRNEGHQISKRTCNLHHHESTQFVYFMESL